jgi:hypothetical protein
MSNIACLDCIVNESTQDDRLCDRCRKIRLGKILALESKATSKRATHRAATRKLRLDRYWTMSVWKETVPLLDAIRKHPAHMRSRPEQMHFLVTQEAMRLHLQMVEDEKVV